MNDSENPPKKHGCFFYGCLTVLGLTLFLALAVVLTTAYVVHRVNVWILANTDTAPAALPKVEMPADQLEALKKRVNDFGSQLRTNTNLPALTLDTRECNALLQDTGALKDMKLNDRIYLNLESNAVKAQVSVPLDQFDRLPFLKTKGRYLNGTADLGATVSNGELQVAIKGVEVKGKPLPQRFVTQLQLMEHDTLVNDVNLDPTNRSLMEHMTVEILDGRLVVKPK